MVASLRAIVLAALGCRMLGTSPLLSFDSPSADALPADDAFWRLYDFSFPSSEREPRSVILESLRNGVGFAIRVRDGACTVGLAIVHMLREPPVLFLVYLAISPELRSRHIGTDLFEKVWAEGAERYRELGRRPVGIVWEVDIPELAPGEQEIRQSRCRIAFFTRLGAQILSGPYFQPPVNGIASVPMLLMFRPAPGSPIPDNSGFRALIRGIYFEKYHEANRIPLPVVEDLRREIETRLNLPSRG